MHRLHAYKINSCTYIHIVLVVFTMKQFTLSPYLECRAVKSSCWWTWSLLYYIALFSSLMPTQCVLVTCDCEWVQKTDPGEQNSPVLLPGPNPVTFWSRVWHSTTELSSLLSTYLPLHISPFAQLLHYILINMFRSLFLVVHHSKFNCTWLTNTKRIIHKNKYHWCCCYPTMQCAVHCPKDADRLRRARKFIAGAGATLIRSCAKAGCARKKGTWRYSNNSAWVSHNRRKFNTIIVVASKRYPD